MNKADIYTLSNSWKHQTTLAYGQSSSPARKVPVILVRWAHPAVATDKTTNLAILETTGVPRIIHRTTRDVSVGG